MIAPTALVAALLATLGACSAANLYVCAWEDISADCKNESTAVFCETVPTDECQATEVDIGGIPLEIWAEGKQVGDQKYQVDVGIGNCVDKGDTTLADTAISNRVASVGECLKTELDYSGFNIEALIKIISVSCECDDPKNPVCGSDGITYSSPCGADCEGVSHTVGSCWPVAPALGAVCPAESFPGRKDCRDDCAAPLALQSTFYPELNNCTGVCECVCQKDVFQCTNRCNQYSFIAPDKPTPVAVVESFGPDWRYNTDCRVLPQADRFRLNDECAYGCEHTKEYKGKAFTTWESKPVNISEAYPMLDVFGESDGVVLEYFPTFQHCGDWSPSPHYASDIRAVVSLESGILSASVDSYTLNGTSMVASEFRQSAVIAWRICPATVYEPAPFQASQPASPSATPVPADTAPSLTSGETIAVIVVPILVVVALVVGVVVWRKQKPLEPVHEAPQSASNNGKPVVELTQSSQEAAGLGPEGETIV